MPDKYAELYSQTCKLMRPSEIREILKLTQRPEFISFAGGLPGPEAFPIKEVDDICHTVMTKYGTVALQYGVTEGLPALKEQLIEYLAKDRINVDMDNLYITTGSQQGLDLIGKVFIDPQDKIFTGAPTYFAGVAIYTQRGAIIEQVPLDANGMQVDVLAEKLHRFHRHGENIKFIYEVPSFQNPSGVTMTEKRRKRMLSLAYDYDTLIVEDDPYGKLRYEGVHIRPIKSWDTEGRVIYLGTFSKIFAPGLRLAWTAADKEIVGKLVIGKQSADLNTPMLNQLIAAEFMRRGCLEKQIEIIKEVYGKKRTAMLSALKREMPDDVIWTEPKGGMFLWVTLPEWIDTKEMLKSAINEKVVYVSGSAFYPDGSGRNQMRLNFSYSSVDQIYDGIKRLARVIKKEIELKRPSEKMTRDLMPYITP